MPIAHVDGRIRYIVDLIDDKTNRPTKFDTVDAQILYQKNKSASVINDVIKLRGVELLGTTSHVGISFVAYLTEHQVDKFAKDKRVLRLTQDNHVKLSALWNTYVSGSGELISWGREATGVTYGASNGTATIYVLDTGVDIHSDLNVAYRLLASPFTTAGPLPHGHPTNPIGCYPHSTHVAGIVGSYFDNFGSVGINPGVKIISVAVGDENSGGCSIGTPESNFGLGLDLIYTRVGYSGEVGIINISFNGASVFASNQSLGQKIAAAATPSGLYKGSLVVQSAGNFFSDAYAYAYNATSASDGILVVGGIDENGQPVVPLNQVGAYDNGALTALETGSNYGASVEVWAPSQRIYSTWSGGGYVYLSGTSMAAPHVAGLASILLENNPTTILTSVDLETAVRGYFKTIAGVTHDGANLRPVNIASFNTSAASARANLEIVEGTAPTFTRSGSNQNTINFTKSQSAVNLQYEVTGASATNGCNVSGWRNSVQYLATVVTTATYTFTSLVPGTYYWQVDCYSWDSSATTTATATATITP